MDGHYAMVFTCKRCKSRSVRKISKQGYHKGTVLITCPGCNNRHVVADHLRVCIGFNLLPSPRGSPVLPVFEDPLFSLTSLSETSSTSSYLTHLQQIFTDRPQTIEDILAARGESIRKVSLDDENDWEFLADGSIVSRTAKSSPRVLDEDGNVHDREALERILESHGVDHTDRGRSLGAGVALGRVGHDGHDGRDGVRRDGGEYVGHDGQDGRERLDDEDWQSTDEHGLAAPRWR